MKHQISFLKLLILKSLSMYKAGRNVQESPMYPLPILTSYITTPQYQNQEMDNGTMHTSYPDFTCYMWTHFGCVHMCNLCNSTCHFADPPPYFYMYHHRKAPPYYPFYNHTHPITNPWRWKFSISTMLLHKYYINGILWHVDF